MPAGAAQNEQVVDMVDYLRGTIGALDAGLVELQARRTGLAVRLAAMEAAGDPAVLAAALDYEQRVADGRAYEDAEDADALIKEAHGRYAP